jgi:hypothetical protein
MQTSYYTIKIYGKHAIQSIVYCFLTAGPVDRKAYPRIFHDLRNEISNSN